MLWAWNKQLAALRWSNHPTLIQSQSTVTAGSLKGTSTVSLTAASRGGLDLENGTGERLCSSLLFPIDALIKRRALTAVLQIKQTNLQYILL